LTQIVPKDTFRDYIGHRRQADEWFRITQDRIDKFADATDDHQYIHVDPERASEGPFGKTVAHGFLTLSLLSKLLEPIMLMPEDIVMGVNYGLNRVRFPHPVLVDSEVRAAMTLIKVTDLSPERVLLTSDLEVEIRGVEKPALVAESLAMWVVGHGDDVKSSE